MSVPMPLVPLAVASDVPVLKANSLLQAVFSTLKSYCIENEQTKTKPKQACIHYGWFHAAKGTFMENEQ